MTLKDMDNIPKGNYCYTEISCDANGLNRKLKMCPYWSIVEDKPYQKNGYCSFLGIGDWEGSEVAGFGLLWDHVKLCDTYDYPMLRVYNEILKNTRALDPACAKIIDECFWELI